jgi:hypothetical protein
MSNRFVPPSAEELKARGLNPDGTSIKKEAAKKAPAKKKAATKK